MISAIVLWISTIQQGWGPRGLASSSRTPRGQNLAALALPLNLFGLGLDAALLSLGVSILVAGIYASVILTFAKIHLASPIAG
jgi:hypothetical protein